MVLEIIHQKNIACLESLWNKKIDENRLTVYPLLDLVKRSSKEKINYSYLSSNTKEEFIHNFNKFKKLEGYGILYLAFHGSQGKIFFNEGSYLTIGELGNLMRGYFSNWVIIFGSCSTLRILPVGVRSFIQKTKTAMLIGYTKKVNWVDSAAIELLLMTRLQNYKDMKRFWNFFSIRYSQLLERTGMKAFT